MVTLRIIGYFSSVRAQPNPTGPRPNWANVCKIILLVQPSSAAAERVFSLLQNTFSRQQSRSLEDYVAVSMMLQYNYKKC